MPVRRRRSGGVFFAASFHSSESEGNTVVAGSAQHDPRRRRLDRQGREGETAREEEEGLSKLAAFSLGATERHNGWLAGCRWQALLEVHARAWISTEGPTTPQLA